MNIIFLGTTGVHHSLVAANIYLERLHKEQYRDIPNFANLDLEFNGFPLYIGEDKMGNRIYSLGGGKDWRMAKKSIDDLTALLGYSHEDLTVRPVSIWGDRLLAVLCKIPPVLGGKVWSGLASVLLIKLQMKAICRAASG